MQKAADLVKRQFQNSCNFYLPNSVHASLDRPEGVRLYEGDFVHDVDRQEEIVALHLSASTSAIVLLLGFDLTPLTANPDQLQAHQAQHHRNLLRQAMVNYNQVQWVVVDHPGNLDPKLANLDNILLDTMQTVLTMGSD
jgi:hypothetical protein